MEEGLVIKSDKEWIQYFRSRVSGIIPFMLMEIVVVIAFNYDLRKRNSVIPEIADVLEKCIIVGFIIVNIFLILNIYRMWRDIGRELIIDKTGVLVKMILSILVYTLFSRMFDLMQPPAVKHSIAVV